jgi:hypothetical protein
MQGRDFFRCAVMMSSTDCSDEEDVVANYYFRRTKQEKKIGFIRISKKNIRCRLFVAAKEPQQTDSKFIAFYRMSKVLYGFSATDCSCHTAAKHKHLKFSSHFTTCFLCDILP